MSAVLPEYAELHCLSNFSFLRGASHPKELVEQALKLGYRALAITDECSLAGVVRAHLVAKEKGLPLLIGAEFAVEAEPPFRLVVLACDREGYGNLSEFITRLRRNSPKGSYRLRIEDIEPAALDGCLLLWVPDRTAKSDALLLQGRWLRSAFPDRAWIAVELLHAVDDKAWLQRLRDLGERVGLPLVAAGDVHMHMRSRRHLQDVLTAIRIGKPLTECGEALYPNAERHLRSRLRLGRLYPPDLLQATLDIAARCDFSLDELRYEYPEEVVPAGQTPQSHLRHLTYEGAKRRFPGGISEKVHAQIEEELRIIGELEYEKFFLTVHDIVHFARGRGILCQGRGSAANSTVCYCLGITEVSPEKTTLLFGRFLSKERNEPPDIDVDFEHERREEVIQYLYGKYGRDRTAIAATVICYRMRSAIRDVGKALGFDAQAVDRVAKNHQWWDAHQAIAVRLQEAGLDPQDAGAEQWLALTLQLLDFPRHLSQHTGGFVIARGPVSRIVPIENAAMADRTVIQWDKDDLDTLGLIKVDVLALGMLSAIRRALEFMSQRYGWRHTMQDIPQDDRETYEMICKADTVGVFQIESRAQQSMLPRLQPRVFYDLVVEVAIVRPGPIQGGMVHPYLECRRKGEPVHDLKDELKPALGRTLGIPIFQEQVMQIAMIAADFTPGEADQLRRAMAAWKRKGGLGPFHDKLVGRMKKNGYDPEFAEAIFRQIEGFGEYGFPESHAYSFALLAYVSSWLKRHEPAAFLAALLNSQPMGFYSASQLVQDARRHDVEVRPVDVSHSEVQATLEYLPRAPAVRLGLETIAGLSEAVATRIVAARRERPFENAADLARRAALTVGDMKRLAAADALASLAGHRRQQFWEAAASQPATALLVDAPIHEQQLLLPEASEAEEILVDHAALGLSLRRHPMALLRPELNKRRMLSSTQLRDLPGGRYTRTCGLVTVRQQPGTAKGTIFVSLEDEDGTINVIVWRHVRERFRIPLLRSRLMAVHGQWQRQGAVQHLIADRLEDWSHLIGTLRAESRDFH